MTRRRLTEEDLPASSEPAEPYHLLYRPRMLGEVVGQDAVIKALKANLKASSRPHSFLFTGPSGTGKTTLSRIVAAEMGCDPGNVLEIDAASNSGIDAMKEVLQGLRYQGFGQSPNRAYIIDECHALSKQAWQTLLKPIEEPPPHVFFFLCTTETGKVPETIVTRCQSYLLRPLRFDDLMDLLIYVADKEKLETPDAILEIVARACDGSPRKALVMLAMVQDCDDPRDAERILESPLENKEIIDLCRALIDRRLQWKKLVETLRSMPEMQAESARIIITAYISGCIMNPKGSDADVARLLRVADCFSRPFNPTDKLMPLLLAFGELIFD